MPEDAARYRFDSVAVKEPKFEIDGVFLPPDHSKEQKNTYPFRSFLNSEQFHRFYLDELGDARDLPLGLGLMALIVEKPKKMADTARHLLDRSQTEISNPQASRAIMEMLTTILVYHFSDLRQAEVEKMLGVNVKLQDTRIYKDAKAEGEVIGKQQGKTEERRSIIFLLLDRKAGKLSARTKKKINALNLSQLEILTIALLDFETIAEVEDWLSKH
jgi:predicted transposase YdaD